MLGRKLNFGCKVKVSPQKQPKLIIKFERKTGYFTRLSTVSTSGKSAESLCSFTSAKLLLMNKRTIGLLILIFQILTGCDKEPGIGGTSSVSGKVYAYDYDSDLNNLRAQYYAPDEDVYIIYGTDSIFSDRTQTSYDGSFRFRYLRPGTYTIFAYSKNIVTKLPPLVTSRKTVEITAGGQSVVLADIEINK